VDAVRGIEITKEIGFDSYDLMPMNPLTPQDRKRMRERLIELQLPCSAITFAGFSLTDLNTEVRKLTVEWLEKQLEIGFDMGCEMMVLSLGEYALEKQELSPQDQWRWAVEGVSQLAEKAEKLGMIIALETLAHKFALLNSVDLLNRFITEVGHPAVNANVDLSHMYLNGDQPDALKKIQKYIAHVHISDCKDKIHGDLPPGRGNVPLKEYLRALRDLGFEGNVMVELEWNHDPQNIRSWIKESYEATSRMMMDLKVRF